jgi:UDP-4-amino-4,6-dideoxy-N-acetyl-beta-L-altrosamine N-acetyltransferase
MINSILLETHTHKKIYLCNILDTNSTVHNSIRDIRNSDAVRKYMYSQHIISLEEHINWLIMLKNNPQKNIVFVIFNEQKEPCGILSVTNIDLYHQKAEWAFYVKPDERGGIGRTLEKFVLSYVFDDLKLNKLNCEVLYDNQVVINLHHKFFFQTEGVRRSHCFKENVFCDVVLMGITKQDYINNLEKISGL